MKLTIAILMLALTTSAQSIWRNQFTTNRPPAMVYGNNNLSFTNVTGQVWHFFGDTSNTVATLGIVTQAVSAVSGLGSYLTKTNPAAFGTFTLNGSGVGILSSNNTWIGTNYYGTIFVTNLYGPVLETITNIIYSISTNIGTLYVGSMYVTNMNMVNVTAPRMAMFNANKDLTNSSLSEADIATTTALTITSNGLYGVLGIATSNGIGTNTILYSVAENANRIWKLYTRQSGMLTELILTNEATQKVWWIATNNLADAGDGMSFPNGFRVYGTFLYVNSNVANEVWVSNKFIALPGGTNGNPGQIIAATATGQAWSNNTASGSSPTTTWGDMSIRGLTSDERLPFGGVRIFDSQLPQDSSGSQGGATLLAAGGAESAWSTPANATLRGHGNYFLRLRIRATNGIGQTHYARSMYASAGSTYRLHGTNSFIFDGAFEDAFTNSLLQVGLLGSATTSNQTTGIFWEFNPAISANWVARTVGSGASTNFDTGIAVALNAFTTLGWSGGTNYLRFYTNGVVCFTNNNNVTMPAGDLALGYLLVNRNTNDTPVLNTFLSDNFYFWDQ